MADRRVLLDTGPLVAVFSERDEHHERCVETLKGLTPPLLTCCAVVTEAAWLLRTRPASLNQMFDGFEQGMFALLPIATGDLPAIAAIMRRYHDAGLQFADVAPVHHAESEDIRNVFTVDRRDFSIIRFKRNRPLQLIPDAR